MNHLKVQLSQGLYLVATPIGTARDITLRALDILASADVLAAEDTRSLRRLMEIHSVPLAGRPLISYHDHSSARTRETLLNHMAQGASVAYASEAGTPLIADPGYHLTRDVADAGFAVTSAPGPSAVATALSIAGLPTDAFYFAGFLANAGAARRKALEALREVQATLVFYESPRRLGAMLKDAADALGDTREAAVCREMTKKFEEVRRASLGELRDYYAANTTKGEVVVLIDRGRLETVNEADLESEIKGALETMSVRDASDAVATAFGVKRRKVYQLALKLSRDG